MKLRTYKENIKLNSKYQVNISECTYENALISLDRFNGYYKILRYHSNEQQLLEALL